MSGLLYLDLPHFLMVLNLADVHIMAANLANSDGCIDTGPITIHRRAPLMTEPATRTNTMPIRVAIIMRCNICGFCSCL